MTAVSGIGTGASIDDSSVDASKYWLDYFGLSESPFQTTARFSMYYPLPQWQSVLSFFHKNCRGDDSLCLVTGMLGSGKTTLLRQFLEHVDRNVMVCSIKADVTSSVNTLLDAMTEDFCLPVASGRTIQSRLNKYLSALDADRSYVLVVDDAHDLPLDTLAALLHFCVAQKHKTKLRVMLFGELSLQGRIESLMNKRGKASKLKVFNLEPLSLEDTKQYLRHRFIKAGMTREMPFAVSDIARVHRLSGGLPGRINRVAQQTLIDMMKSDQRDDTAALTYRLSMDEDGFGLRWFAVALFVALVSCSVWMFHGQINDQVMSPILAKKDTSLGSSPILAANDTSQRLAHDVVVHKAKQRASTAKLEGVDPWAVGQMVKAVSGIVAKTVAQEQQAAKQAQALRPTLKTAKQAAPILAAAPHHANPRAAAMMRARQKMGAAKAQSLRSRLPFAANRHQNRMQHLAMMQSRRLAQGLHSGQGYALQLSAVQHFNGVPKDLQGTPWANMVSPVKVMANGKPMTLVLLGHFSTKAQAKALLARLPASLQQQKPWIRSASSIKDIMPNG